jgi:tetratricopeptide (TPR) repeat protein
MNGANRTRPLLTGVALVLSIAGLYVLDVFLARVERNEITAEARSFYRQAQAFDTKHDTARAVEMYRRALTLDRNNRQYQLSLARALIAARRFDEARPLLSGILGRDPNDGQTNLEMARLMAAAGHVNDAVSHYHRAIFGAWPQNAEQRRIDVRLELIGFLSRQRRHSELLAEVLALEDLALNNPPLERRVADLFLQAGSPSRAAAAFRLLTREYPKDEQVYKGLGEAELQLGNYRAAQSAFISALRRQPADDSIRARLALTTQLAQLDPTPRRLPWSDKLGRSRKLLGLAIEELNKCAQGQESDEITNLRKQAQDALHGKNRAAQDRVEGNLLLAEQVWSYMRRACPDLAARPDDPLHVLMRRLEQEP